LANYEISYTYVLSEKYQLFALSTGYDVCNKRGLPQYQRWLFVSSF